MFATLHDLRLVQAKVLAGELLAGRPAAVKVDPDGACIVFVPTPGKLYELDFACARIIGDEWAPVPLTPMQHNVLWAWASKAVPMICKVWKILGESPATAEKAKGASFVSSFNPGCCAVSPSRSSSASPSASTRPK